ncbi:MAG: amino acid ABC transporter permease [Methyloligellaceae bacterium]
MSETAATKRYEPGTHPDLPPPTLSSGPLYWMKENLFSSWYNVLLTIVGVWFLWTILPPLIEWLWLDAVFKAADRAECQKLGDGACWAFISERYKLFIYGFYPEPERWRVNLAFVLLLVALAPLLFDGFPQRGKAMIFSILYPFLAAWLLLGGMGLEPVSTDKFGGTLLNIIVGVTGIAFSLPIGIILALGRASELPAVRSVCIVFIEFIRGVPLITLLFVASTMLSYFLPPGTSFDLLMRVLIMVTLFASGYMAEVIRGGLQAIPRGQYEAADSLGLKYWQSMRLVILPQALKISIPGIVNTFIGLFKDTTLVIIIGLLDILGMGRASLADAKWAGLAAEVYLSIALFFFLFCFAMSRYSLYLESKLETGHKT